MICWKNYFQKCLSFVLVILCVFGLRTPVYSEETEIFFTIKDYETDEVIYDLKNDGNGSTVYLSVNKTYQIVTNDDQGFVDSLAGCRYIQYLGDTATEDGLGMVGEFIPTHLGVISTGNVNVHLTLIILEDRNNVPANTNSKTVDMYRLYNPNSGEHFYTSNASEKDNLVSLGWNYEGIGWKAPKGGHPVYRLYNANGGEHHYTLNVGERDGLVKAGWIYEGIGWYSEDANEPDAVPLYREYNPNAFANNHNYTTSQSEHNWLISLGWKDEGIAWYGY